MTADPAVLAILDVVTQPIRRRDAGILLELYGRATAAPARAWPGRIIGFGDYHYRYESGREGDGPAAAFSPRAAATSLYLVDGVGAHRDELAGLGDHSTGVGCVYIRNLDRVDLAVLESIVAASYRAAISGVFFDRARDSG